MLTARCSLLFFAAEYFFLPAPAPGALGLTNNQELFSRTSRVGRIQVKKRSFGGPCEYRTNPSGSSVPESSPVAEANSSVFAAFCWCTTLDAGQNTRDSKLQSGVPLRPPFKEGNPCSRRFFIYTTGPARAQGDVYEASSRSRPRHLRPPSASLVNVPSVPDFPDFTRSSRTGGPGHY